LTQSLLLVSLQWGTTNNKSCLHTNVRLGYRKRPMEEPQ